MEKNIIWTNEITNSSHIKQIGYAPKSKNLHIIFKNDDHYVYKGVPSSTIIGLLEASSHGTYFWQNIREFYVGDKV